MKNNVNRFNKRQEELQEMHDRRRKAARLENIKKRYMMWKNIYIHICLYNNIKSIIILFYSNCNK